jgi:uncharacterized protein (DUF58 family)
MSPSPRAAVAVVVVALAATLIPIPIALLAIVAIAAAAAVDINAARHPPLVERRVSAVLARGVAAPLTVTVDAGAAHVRVRQPVPPDLALAPSEDDRGLLAQLLPLRRGRHTLPPVAARVEGPLRLGRRVHVVGEATEVAVYPDLPAARRLVQAVRQGRFRDQGRMTRGPLGLGTEFERVREYLPDDDIRQVNWRATQRLGRPMSNEYRVEQDRDVMLVVDAGRLMAAPVGDRTRLDAALDAAVAVALVADEMGDRCGTVAFADGVLRRLAPRRAGADAVVRALFDLEPTAVDSDYELAFRAVGGGKRALVMVLTDLLDVAAARSLIDAVPVLARRHAVVVATTTDPDIATALTSAPARPLDVYATAVALDVVAERSRAAAAIRAAGAGVIEAPPATLAAACVRAYLRAKARARL